jgi:hypothetical protein
MLEKPLQHSTANDNPAGAVQEVDETGADGVDEWRWNATTPEGASIRRSLAG